MSQDKNGNTLCSALHHHTVVLQRDTDVQLFLHFYTGLVFVYYFLFVCYIICFKIADKPEITAHPKNVAIREKESIALSCNATGNPEPAISWTKDGSPISRNSRISLLDKNKQLAITNVNRTYSGEYRCVASNSLGNDTSNAAEVDVKCECGVLFLTF